MEKFKRNKLVEFLGWKYIVNHATKSIHKVTNASERCNFQLMLKCNTEYVRERKMEKLIVMGYDGCGWCFPEFHNKAVNIAVR
jgi:hypothetical protein